MRDRWKVPPNLADIEALARAALARLPAAFRQWLGAVPIRVQEFADEETLADLAIEHPLDLMGLYRGIGMGARDAGQGGVEVDMIFLYRRAILDYWCDGEESLAHVVGHVLVHEIGHHFDLSDDDMERIENGL